MTAALAGQAVTTVYVAEGALDAYHAQESQHYSRFTKDETLAHLRQNDAEVRHFLSEINDTDLTKPLNTPMIVKWFWAPHHGRDGDQIPVDRASTRSFHQHPQSPGD